MEGGLGCPCKQELLQQVIGRMDTGADPGDTSSPVSPGVTVTRSEGCQGAAVPVHPTMSLPLISVEQLMQLEVLTSAQCCVVKT